MELTVVHASSVRKLPKDLLPTALGLSVRLGNSTELDDFVLCLFFVRAVAGLEDGFLTSARNGGSSTKAAPMSRL